MQTDPHDVRNVVRPRAQEWAIDLVERDVVITPAHLDTLENELIKSLNNPKITRNHIRTEIVGCILDNHGVRAFGVEPTVEKKEISEKAIKKYSKKRK